MDGLEADISARTLMYGQRYAIRPIDRLGFGKDATVWATDAATAIKVFVGAAPYARELAAYRRLQGRGVLDIRGHNVPQLLRFDDECLVIEMTIVRRPFVLDFASAWLDEAPEFGDEVTEAWLEDKREEFGAHWPAAAGVLAGLRSHGVHLLDVHPGNIGFADE